MKEQTSLLPRLSVARPVTVAMCLVALLAVGLVAYARISVQLFPSGHTPRFLYVWISYPNTTPQEAEQQIARPLEETLRTVKGIDNIRTYSSTRGVSAPLRFRKDADMKLAYNQLTDRIERLKSQLPDEARDDIFIWKYNEESDWEIMWVGVSLDSTIADPYRYMETHIKRPLERVDGVAKVDFWGVYEKEVMVEVDQDRISARGVSTYEVVEALQSDNFALSGGYVREGGKKFYVRSVARYRSLQEIENLWVSSRGSGVRLKDVADVVYDIPERTWYQRIDGQPAVSIGIYRESGANIVDVCDRVVRTLREIEKTSARPHTETAVRTQASGASEAAPALGRPPGGMHFNIFFNQGQFIRESIQNLQGTATWGGLFAAFVLFYYLRAVRMTLIITLAIPLCVTITLTALYFFGWSLNLLTMMGLMVGVGMVVDNAIVILENIYRMRGKGHPPRDASVYGASEVALAITTATLTTIVVFLPLILMSGDEDLTFFLSRIGVPVIVALLGSLFVALIFIPLAAVRFGGAGVKPDPKTVRWTRNLYNRALTWTLSHRRDTLLIVLALFTTISIPVEKVKKSDSMRGNINDIYIRVYTPPNFSLEEIGRVLEEVETYLDTQKEAYGIRTIRTSYWIGGGGLHTFLDADPNQAWWYVSYKDLRKKLGIPADRQMDRSLVVEDLKKNMPQFVGVRFAVEGRGGESGDPSVSVYLYGDDTEVLSGMIDEVERRLRNIPSVVSIDSDLERADDEVRVTLNRKQAQKYGISAQMVGRSIAFGLQGFSLARYQADDREIQMRGSLEESDRQTLHDLKNFTFRTRSGEEIRLSSIASLHVARGSGTIRREDGKTRLRIQAMTTKDDLKGLYAEIGKAMQGLNLPRGYTWDMGERYEKFQESDNAMIFAVIMAITFVFLLMGVLFESFILPFSVLFSIPFAFLGVYWTLYLTDTTSDFMANVGIIVLIGVVVNNAIVLVDMVNRLRAEGMARNEAILEAGHNRFRPILMTTFTTIFGLMPMAVGNSNMIGIPYAPLGRTMMGGLFASTFLTLLVVPLFYTFLDDLRTVLRRITTAAFRQRTVPGGPIIDKEHAR